MWPLLRLPSHCLFWPLVRLPLQRLVLTSSHCLCSLLIIAISTMSIVLMCFIAIVMDPFLVGAVTSGTRPSPTGTPGRDRSDRCAVAQVEMAPRLGMAPGLQQQRMPHARLAGELPAPISTPTNRNAYRIVQKPISRIANASNSPLTTEMAIHQIMTLTSARHSPHSLIRASQTHGLFRIRIAA